MWRNIARLDLQLVTEAIVGNSALRNDDVDFQAEEVFGRANEAPFHWLDLNYASGGCHRHEVCFPDPTIRRIESDPSSSG